MPDIKTNEPARPQSPVVTISQELRDVAFIGADGKALVLKNVDFLPGGRLTADFGFKSESGPPVFDLVWSVRFSAGKEATELFGGACTCCSGSDWVRVSRFDPSSGDGLAQICIPLLAGNGPDPALAPGANDITVYAGIGGFMTRDQTGRPTNFLRQFPVVRIQARTPALSVVVHTSSLQLDEATDVSIVLGEASAQARLVTISTEGGKTCSCGTGLELPSSIEIPAGERIVKLRATFAHTRHGASDARIRVKASLASGETARSNFLQLSARAYASPERLLTAALESDYHWFSECSRQATAYNGPAFTVCTPCSPVAVFPALMGPVIIYTPHECSLALRSMCVVFPSILKGTMYTVTSAILPCRFLDHFDPVFLYPVYVNGTTTCTTYTPGGAGQAVVDDCMTV
jgi:hypothetical protein